MTMTDQSQDGNQDDAPMPALQQADLDDQTLASLFRDLAALADVRAVRLKGGETQHADNHAVTLDDAAGALRLRSISGVQIDYLLNGQRWIDTLVVAAESIRLVRIRIPDPASR